MLFLPNIFLSNKFIAFIANKKSNLFLSLHSYFLKLSLVRILGTVIRYTNFFGISTLIYLTNGTEKELKKKEIKL